MGFSPTRSFRFRRDGLAILQFIRKAKLNSQTRTINHLDFLLVALILLLLTAMACQPTRPSVPASTATPFRVAKIELVRNQQKWQNAKIPHYRFRLFNGCICEPNEEVLVEVENDQIVSMSYPSGRTMSEYDREYFESLGTMDRLFSTVEGELGGESLKVIVKYDSTYGFPVEVSSERSQGADDELLLMISGFEVLP